MNAFHLNRDKVNVEGSALVSPVVTYCTAIRCWRLDRDYHYRDGRHTLTVPAGFEFDLASIPRILWTRLAPFELSIAAPLIHDWLYRYQGCPPVGSIRPRRVYSRPETDQLFREIMEAEGVSNHNRRLAYWAIRAFGGWAWKKLR